MAEAFLKWPGGKRWLVNEIAESLTTELSGVYYEPFCGAASMYLHIGWPCSHLSDSNAHLIECLEMVRDYPREIAQAVSRFSNTEDCYYAVRQRAPRTPLGRAARFLYLNRTAWGGMYRENLRGEFNVPFGNSDRRIIDKDVLYSASEALAKAVIQTADFEVNIALASRSDVVYCDPPYTLKGQNNGFIRYNEKLFSWEDQVRLALACRKARRRGAFVAVSGPLHPELLALYCGWWAYKVTRTTCISRTLNGRRAVDEVVLFSRRPRPATISQRVFRVRPI